jgi:hypothetical protein
MPNRMNELAENIEFLRASIGRALPYGRHDARWFLIIGTVTAAGAVSSAFLPRAWHALPLLGLVVAVAIAIAALRTSLHRGPGEPSIAMRRRNGLNTLLSVIVVIPLSLAIVAWKKKHGVDSIDLAPVVFIPFLMGVALQALRDLRFVADALVAVLLAATLLLLPLFRERPLVVIQLGLSVALLASAAVVHLQLKKSQPL